MSFHMVFYYVCPQMQSIFYMTAVKLVNFEHATSIHSCDLSINYKSKARNVVQAAPPSRVKILPLTHSASLLAKKQTTRAISRGYPFRTKGDARAAI